MAAQPSRPSRSRGAFTSPAAKRNAKTLRKRLTSAEALLWSELRGYRKSGAHFRRQVPIGRYVADFACHRNKLIVEIDGVSHTYDATIARDAERDCFLNARGYRVLRFTNEDVLRSCGEVIDHILVFTHQERSERAKPREGAPPPSRGRWQPKADGGGASEGSKPSEARP